MMSRARVGSFIRCFVDSASLLRRHRRDEILNFGYQLAIVCCRCGVMNVEQRLHVSQLECQLRRIFVKSRKEKYRKYIRQNVEVVTEAFGIISHPARLNHTIFLSSRHLPMYFFASLRLRPFKQTSTKGSKPTGDFFDFENFSSSSH